MGKEESVNMYKTIGGIVALLALGIGLHWNLQDWQLQSQEGFIEVPGGQVWYQKWSHPKTAHEIPVVVLHGGLGFRHDYLANLKTLAHDRPVILYDQLGGGRSTIPAGTAWWAIGRTIQELDAVINTVGGPKVHIIGSSFGAAFGTLYAYKYPERVATFVAMNPLISAQQWVIDAQKRVQELPVAAQEAITQAIMTHDFKDSAYREACTELQRQFMCRGWWAQWQLKQTFHGLNVQLFKDLWGPSEFTLVGRLKDFSIVDELQIVTQHIPVLICAGLYDEIALSTLEPFTQAQMVIFTNSAHHISLEEPCLFFKTVREFWRNTTK